MVDFKNDVLFSSRYKSSLGREKLGILSWSKKNPDSSISTDESARHPFAIHARMIDVYLGLPRGSFLQLESVTQSNLATDFVYKKKKPLEKPPNGYQESSTAHFAAFHDQILPGVTSDGHVDICVRAPEPKRRVGVEKSPGASSEGSS